MQANCGVAGWRVSPCGHCELLRGNVWSGEEVGGGGSDRSVVWPFLLKTTVFLGGFSNKLSGACRVGWVEGSSFKKGPK